jgi:hypothetical protein
MVNGVQWSIFAFKSFIFCESEGGLGLAEIGLMLSCFFPADG